MKTYIYFIILFTGLNFSAFSQNTLDYYLSEAERNSPLLEKQDNNNKLIEFDFKKYDAIYRSPKVDINSGVIFSPIITKEGANNKFKLFTSGSSDYQGYDISATDGGQYQALVSVEQSLFTKRYHSIYQKNFEIQKAQNRNAVQLTKAELRQTVTHQYILCVQSEKQIENVQKIIKVIEDNIRYMEPLVEKGVYKVIDLKLLEIELEDKRIEEKSLNGSYIDNFTSMNLLCGINDTTIYKLENPDLELEDNMRGNSIFSTQFELDSLSLKNEQKIFNLDYLPKVSLLADAGLNATYRPTADRIGFSVGFVFRWNLFDGHQKRLELEKNEVLLSNIAIDKKNFELKNDIRKMNILLQIDNLDKQMVLLNQQILKYKELLDLYKEEVKDDAISALDLKSLTTDMCSKNQAYTDLQMTKEILINSYNYWNL